MTDDEILEVYRATIRPLYAYVSRRVGGDRALAEDLVQDTWMRALDAWPARGRPDEPLAWLIRVARNTMISHFRRVRPESLDPRTIDLEDPGPLPDEPDRAATISWGLARLRRRHAELIEAFYFDGKSVREIATERSMTEKAVEGRLRRARAVLKKKLAKLVRPRDTPARSHQGPIKERTIHERHT